MIKNKKMEYEHEGTVFEGFCAYDDNFSAKRPLVMVCHDWSGRNEFADQKANKLAELGYVGFAIDMFGKGKIGNSTSEKQALIQPLMSNRKLLCERILSALNFARNIEYVDANRIGAMGFCFGGLCVLDLARSGENINGVISFHGLLSAPSEAVSVIKAKVLALHGHDDPMVPPEQVLSFEKEMTKAKADWQVHVYGNTKHAFTNPLAHDEELGTVYNNLAEKRSWVAAQNFFIELFE